MKHSLIGLVWLLSGCTERLDFRHGSASQGASAGATSESSAGADTAGAGAAGAPALQPLGATAPYHLTLEEECDGPAPDPATFSTVMRVDDAEFRTWGQRQEYMADENVFTQDGHCVIRAENRATAGSPYTSGTLNTAGSFEQLYGFFEARLKPPPSVGLWSVFWLRSLHGWPPSIDLLDYLDQAPETATASYWWMASSGSRSEGRDWAIMNVHEDFHVFGLEWRSGYVAFYLDGQKTSELAPPGGEITVPLYPSFNLSIPTDEQGRKPPDATTIWPADLVIDWIRVYAAD